MISRELDGYKMANSRQHVRSGLLFLLSAFTFHPSILVLPAYLLLTGKAKLSSDENSPTRLQNGRRKSLPLRLVSTSRPDAWRCLLPQPVGQHPKQRQRCGSFSPIWHPADTQHVDNFGSKQPKAFRRTRDGKAKKCSVCATNSYLIGLFALANHKHRAEQQKIQSTKQAAERKTKKTKIGTALARVHATLGFPARLEKEPTFIIRTVLLRTS